MKTEWGTTSHDKQMKQKKRKQKKATTDKTDLGNQVTKTKLNQTTKTQTTTNN